MSAWMYQARRWVSFLLIYALLCGTMPLSNGNHTSASVQTGMALRQTGYLSENAVATQSGIILNGKQVQVQVSGLSFSVTELQQTDADSSDSTGLVTTGSGLVTTGSGLVATGTALELQYGVSESFAISSAGAPALFRFSNTKPLGSCQQFQIITSAAQGFDVWLLDASLTPIAAVQGMGGSQVWRTALANYTTYYLFVCGEADTSGKFLCADVIDDYGNDFSSSGNIYLNREYSIETEIAGDVDVLAFRASSAVSAYRLRLDSVAGSGGTYEVYDQNKKKLAQYSGTMNQSVINMVFTPTAGAKYYFRFTSGETGRKIVLRVAQAVTQYRIVYHLNGGKNAKGNPSYYISTTSKFALQKATRSKYLFYGWYADAAFRTRVQYVQGSVRKNLHLYAKWKKVSPKATSIKSVKSTKTKQAAVKWKAVKSIQGYHLVYGTTRSLRKNVKKKNTKKTSMTLKGLKAGKTYYFKVCTYCKDSKGKKVYSKYSKVKKVTIKEKKKNKSKTKKKTKSKTKSTAKKTTAKKSTAKKKTTKKSAT